MTFQQTLDAMRDAANAVNPTGHFIHGRNAAAANSSDESYPRIHLYPFIQERDPLDTEARTSDLLFSFVNIDSGAQDEDERETIISEMDVLVDAFLSELETTNENDIEFSSVRTEPQYQILEGVSGYSLNLKIKTRVSC